MHLAFLFLLCTTQFCWKRGIKSVLFIFLKFEAIHFLLAWNSGYFPIPLCSEHEGNTHLFSPKKENSNVALTCLCWCGLPLTHTDCLSYSLNQSYRSACSILPLLKRDLIVSVCSLKASKQKLVSICINNSNVLWKFILCIFLSAFYLHFKNYKC